MGAADDWKKPITFQSTSVVEGDGTSLVMIIDDPLCPRDPVDPIDWVEQEWDLHMFMERLRWRLDWDRDRTGVTVTNAPGAAP